LRDDIIRPKIFKGFQINAFFTGRLTGSEPAALSDASGIPQEKIYLPIQKHTDTIITITNNMEQLIGDAVITAHKDVLIGVKTADCVPVLIYDKKRHAAAAVHAGWRGAADAIVKKAVAQMAEKFMSDPSDMFIAIGPAIRWCCYTVGKDVVDAVSAATGDGDYYMQKEGKHCLDLQSANRQQAVTAGIPANHIQVIEECTFCFPDRYFSYRFSRETAGRQGGFIALL